MHDLMEEMGKTIVFQESPNDPSRRSRLWHPEDIHRVLNKNTGTEKVESIVLTASTESDEAYWHPKSFYKMCNLKLLIISCDLHLPLGLECLSSSLKVLIWREYPLEDLPLGVRLDELVHLEMWGSKVKKLWNETHVLKKLKFIDLSMSSDLIETPNISGVPNLEELYLDDCEKLVGVHNSVGWHKNVAILSLIGCENLQNFPSTLEMVSLEKLYLTGCSKVGILPDFGKNMEYLKVLVLKNCKNLLCLPDTISNLKSLKRLDITGCSKVYDLPENISENKALEDLDLSETSIREVSSSLFHLQNLRRLSFRGCSGPASLSWVPFGWMLPSPPTYLSLPPSISGLSSLTELDLSCCGLSRELIPRDIGDLPSLERLFLSGNKDLELPADSIANLSKLQILDLSDCKLESLPVLPPHARLYPQDFEAEASLLDACKLWKQFESCYTEHFESGDREHLDSLQEDKWLQMPGHPHLTYYEASPRFDNIWAFLPSLPYRVKTAVERAVETDFYMSTFILSLSNPSVIVDLPVNCGRVEWWGIAVYVALKPTINELSATDTKMNYISFHWSIVNSDREDGLSFFVSNAHTTADDTHYVLTLLLRENYIYLQRHGRRCQNKGDTDRLHFRRYWSKEFSEGAKLRIDVLPLRRRMKECRWHVLRKEDFKLEDLPKSPNQGVETPNSKDELDREDSTAPAAQNGESPNQLLLSKIFHSSKREWWLSVLAMMLIMPIVGDGLFLSPRQSLDFELQIKTHDSRTGVLKSRGGSQSTRATLNLKVHKPQLQQRNLKPVASLPLFLFSGCCPPASFSFTRSYYCPCFRR